MGGVLLPLLSLGLWTQSCEDSLLACLVSVPGFQMAEPLGILQFFSVNPER